MMKAEYPESRSCPQKNSAEHEEYLAAVQALLPVPLVVSLPETVQRSMVIGLDISPEKSKIVNLKRQYSEFLGFKIKVVRNGRKKNGKPKFTVASYMTEKAEAKIKKTMKQLMESK